MAASQSQNSDKSALYQTSILDPERIRAAQIRLIVGHLIEQTARVGWSELASPRRGPPKAMRARQIAMYLAHVGGGLSLTATGELFARDRRTVAHAAAAIEDGRDVDRHLDRALDHMERAIRLTLARTQSDA